MLYAFDGTWNTDKPGTEHDTNVVWFKRAYQGLVHYMPGVGTRFSVGGAIAGGVMGAGGRDRVDEMFKILDLNLAFDPHIDVVGFSRGAALALAFANRVARHPSAPRVRFLGLWDCVPSFGIPNIDLNVGWDLEFPANVQNAYHALALDERRQTFHLHRLGTPADARRGGRLIEVWFRGVHSDVGGGNNTPALSSITLNWMLRRAKSHDLPISDTVIAENGQRMRPGCPISEQPWYDVVKNRRRDIRAGDRVHTSVTFVPGCHNPPSGTVIVDDDGHETGSFQWEAEGV